jgi:hypothetical protein
VRIGHFFILSLPFLVGCAALSLSGIEAVAVATAVGAPAAVIAGNNSLPESEVYGTYEDGFWFDRELYSVWVIASSPEEAEQVAMNTASQSCTERLGSAQITWSKAWQERKLFIPMKINRFSFEMRFRCVRESAESS